MAQQYPLSIEEMQSALLGSPAFAALMPPTAWPIGIDPNSTDLLNANLVNQTGKNISEISQSAGPIHKASSRTSTGSVANGTTNRRFAPY